MGTTTIQVQDETKILLEREKKNRKLKTFDETIRVLFRKKTPSFYGIFADAKISTKALLKDVRDKHDRF